MPFHIVGVAFSGAGVCSLAVGGCYYLHVLRAAGTALDLEYGNSGINNLVYELDCTEILRAHYVFVVYLQFTPCFKVCDTVASSAQLVAAAAVGGGSVLLEAEIAFAGYGHAESSVNEQFQPQQLSIRTADILFLDPLADILYLRQG